MERIQALIDQLYRQKGQNASPAQLLLTVQLLQSELLKLQQRNGSFGSSKVAVTLPTRLNFLDEEFSQPEPVAAPAPPPTMAAQPSAPAPAVAEPVAQQPAAPVAEPEPVVAQQPPTPPADTPYILRKPAVADTPAQKTEPAPEPVNPVIPDPGHSRYMPSFEPVVAPTLAQHQPPREIHELIGEQKESLNDRLNQQKTELAHVLKDTPIKDLRKGVGINDRFTFVNELFRGDEAMYERSIKTINGFHILSEAEYWINRELKVKLGWNDTNNTVQHFYHLVRRRFS
jgi:hypothetical protein